MYKNELEIDVFRCIRALLKRVKFIALISILFLIIGWGLTINVGNDRYTSVATVYAAADTSYSDATAAVTAMNAYLNVATSYKVCQRASLIMGRNGIDANDIRSALSVNSSAKTSKSSSSINFLASSAISLDNSGSLVVA